MCAESVSLILMFHRSIDGQVAIQIDIHLRIIGSFL